MLDYDGTLVPIAPTPDLAVPDGELRLLLRSLTAREGTTVHLVSGRAAAVLDEWFGDLPLALWAEHGAYGRKSPGAEWEVTVPIRTEWMREVLPVVEETTRQTPGSLIERKRASIAWHYRTVDQELGSNQAHDLRVRLRPVVRAHALELLDGRRVLEIRMAGVSKAVVAHHLVDGATSLPAILAIGDDWTDEDLFEALPDSSVTIAVGRRTSCADYQLSGESDVRALLQALL